MARHRIGIIGCGSVSDFGHLPAITRVNELEVVTLFDPVFKSAELLSQKYNVGTPTDDLDAFYQHDLDAVLIASPMPTHRDQVLRAAKEGVHVLCEKPIAETAQDAKLMEDTMRKTGKGFFIGFVYRFSPVSSTLKRWVNEGRIGDLRSARLQYLWHLHGEWMQDPVTSEWIKSPRWASRMEEGGPMIDCGVHFIDLLRWITGSEITRVQGSGAWVSDYRYADHVSAALQFQDGLNAWVEVSFTYGHNAKDPAPIFSYELIGTGGVAKYDRNGYVLELRNGEGTFQEAGASEKNFDGMWLQMSHFLSTGDPGDLCSPGDAMRATEIAIQATPVREAAKSASPSSTMVKS